ncbi:aminotransferase class V-fold PLP-dependent enzyme [Cyclobacterium amurskyense]|uniref:Aminotransferase class V n=1 Tax=Cyclobacterium amurskyense TaxID=320787 RepID=A0A0H4PJI4_9BACT|nr:aminotransferase class V-fold PLP-dependent enzyme [Cyclobacterium amurskyense]AKP53210.1 Aminotransferase class V [Cyclobacterium amurskyense]
MISRRKVINILSSLPFGGLFLGALLGTNSARSMPTTTVSPSKKALGKSIYDSIGVRPLINARGTVTVVGATRILPEVQVAMDEAVKDFVQIDELMNGVGLRLAEVTGAEWGVVSSGASAAISIATAGCVTGGDPDKIWQIPNLDGMKDEVIIPSYSRSAYDAAAKAVGVRMVEVNSPEELKAALGPRTAMIMVLASGASEDGPLSLKIIAALAKPLKVPILVDAAAEGLEVPNPHIAQGADMVAYSGGKYLRGPQCAGLLIGRKDLVQAAWITSAPHHGFGRGFKVGREEIMGMLTAVEMWKKRDHTEEWRMWISWANYISHRLEQVPGVKTEILLPKGRSNRSPSLHVEWDISLIPLTGQDVEELLWENNPRIAVSGAGSYLPFPPNMEPNIRINPSQLTAGEEKVIAKSVYELLSNPPQMQKPSGLAAFNLSGLWDLEIQFVASIVNQTFMLEQKGNDIFGTHHASFGARELTGTLHGNDILIRSSYTSQGVRLNFQFTGVVSKDNMDGIMSLGEYGRAEWKAKRRQY